MHKKYLLSCTAIANLFLSILNFDANAQNPKNDITSKANETINNKGPTVGAIADGPDGKIELNGGAVIKDVDIGLFAQNGGTITMKDGSILANETGVLILQESPESLANPNSLTVITLKNVTISAHDGIITHAGEVKMTGGSITAKANAVIAQYDPKNSKNTLITLAGTYIKSELNGLHAIGEKAKIVMTGGQIFANKNAFIVENGGQLEITNVSSAKANDHGIILRTSNEEGNPAGSKHSNKVTLTNTKLVVKDGIGILGTSAKGEINLKNSEIHADVLLDSVKQEEGNIKNGSANLTLKAENSILEGSVRTAKNDNVSFDLNNTIWNLKTSNEKDENGQLLDIKDRSYSKISKLTLKDSTIFFKEPDGDNYHTLLIDSKTPASFVQDHNFKNDPIAYIAEGNAKIYINSQWSNGAKIGDQKTDRLLINGDVLGTTIVYVKIKENNTDQEDDSIPLNKQGISLIQVSGKADKNSFKLANNYITLNDSPYKYTLNAYGKDSSNGESNSDQNLVNPGDDFWDFRLQRAYLDPDKKIRAVASQLASYLILPNALFSAGLTDMDHQETTLSHIRSNSLYVNDHKNNSFSLSSYGHTMALSSERTALEYGYGANVNYGALQTRLELKTLERKNSTTYTGFLGTYGSLSFTPKDMADSSKNNLNKWSITAYSSTHYDSGLYVNTLLSYGIVNGNTTNDIIGNTSTLDGTRMWGLSATVGQLFETNVENLLLESQAQVAYQNLIFPIISDVDGFKVDMGSPHQWLVRLGGRLTKTVVKAENENIISFYNKLNLMKTFGSSDTIKIGDIFHVDPMGSLLEGGVGINAQLFQQVSLHGDISHRHKLQKAGISGNIVSGGLRYNF
ncbi:autotransporter outer membrane beta-barrel domain-containing protein [Bartonella ancashensis]|uniref:Type V autotransporter n=1 Tax=Bartonella ancashensis TaxID=1318743 RepID=A0A0M4L606_9HYPH|nr:autotransporter outer membrane beta-barrel domain-containing protein [Bartonella ancashensis]ALE02958.1 Type V autotransporter [Bartonella ancashensis]